MHSRDDSAIDLSYNDITIIDEMNEDNIKANIDKLVTDIRMSGAVQDAFQIARSYIYQAIDILEKQPDCVEKQALQELSEYVILRHI